MVYMHDIESNTQSLPPLLLSAWAALSRQTSKECDRKGRRLRISRKDILWLTIVASTWWKPARKIRLKKPAIVDSCKKITDMTTKTVSSMKTSTAKTTNDGWLTDLLTVWTLLLLLASNSIQYIRTFVRTFIDVVYSTKHGKEEELEADTVWLTAADWAHLFVWFVRSFLWLLLSLTW